MRSPASTRRASRAGSATSSALLVFNAAGFVLLYAILRLQDLLPLNPQGFGGMREHLAFNTAVIFVTNTNWQSYGGETTLSYFSQMVGLTVQNFVSAATGMAVVVPLARAFGRAKATTVGNFWVDLTRITLYVLLPLSIVIALALIALGVPQTLAAYVDATTLEGAKQTIAQGPVASQIAIKQLGTNGGGFFNVNSAHPFENPNIWTNIIEVWAILALALGARRHLRPHDRPRARGLGAARRDDAVHGRRLRRRLLGGGRRQPADARAWASTAATWKARRSASASPQSVTWATFTTGASNGSVNSMHDSYMPLGGLVPLFLIQLGEVVPGGVGSGLYGIVVFAIIAVFVAGLMVGRTPEYLGKKLEAQGGEDGDAGHADHAALHPRLQRPSRPCCRRRSPASPTRARTASPRSSTPSPRRPATTARPSPASPPTRPGTTRRSASPCWSAASASSCRCMAIAGSLAAKPKLAPSAGTFPTDGPLFVGLLIGVILILGGLQFFPALALGPIVEHFQMLAGKTF